MIDLDAALDVFATELANVLSLSTTRDPALITPPCVYVGLPTITSRTMGATQLLVPVSIIAEGPGDAVAGRWLLDTVQTLLEVTSTREALPRPVTVGSVDFPAYQVTTTLQVRSTE